VQLSWTLWHSPHEKKSMTSSRTELGLDLHSHAVQCGHEGKQTANPQLGSKPVGAFELVFSSTKFHIVCCHGCFRGSWDGGTCDMGVKLVAVDAGDFCSLLTLLRMISSRE
jgi:hypothetical protein